MKKKLALFLALVMLLLTACGTAQPSNTNHSQSTGSTEATIDNTTNTGTAESTGDSSGTGTTDTTTESTDGTQSPTEETSKPTDGATVPEDYTLKISKNTLSLEVGQIGNLTAEYTGTGTLVWKTSDSSKATVSNGKVTAKAAGTVVITITDGVKSSQCVVTITQKETPVDVTLKLSKSSMSLKVGNSETLSVTYTGTKSLTWSSSNSAVASVSNGKVTAKAAGKAVSSVTVTNPTAPVVVNLTVSPTSLNLVVGNTSTLTYSYNGTGTLSWSSDNTSVVTVSNGKVTAKAAGNAKVTVTDGNKSATCSITVTAPVTASLKINTKEDTVVLVGNTLQIDYTYTGNKSLTWTSGDTSVLTVDGSGKVTAKAAGWATVKVTDGTLTKRVTLEVKEQDTRPLATSLVEMSHNAPLYDGVTKYAGDYMTFQVYAMPEEANRLVTVTSNNSSVVSVSYNADSRNITCVTLNFKSAGTATVTITSADGNKSKSYSITVKGSYACNPGSGILTPEQFVNCFNGVTRALGMNNDYTPSGYLVLTLSASELTWSRVRREAEAEFHHWYQVGMRCLVLTYEGPNADGNHVFYVHC